VFGVSYSDDIRKVKDVIWEVLNADDRILEDPKPTVAVGALADSSVNFLVRPWVKTGDYWDVYWDLTEKMKLRFDEERISIPFPQRDVHLFQPAGGTQESAA
jgi:small conductance mechanosensitive channel